MAAHQNTEALDFYTIAEHERLVQMLLVKNEEDLN
ncbi:MAG: hypothetical protein ACJAUR_000361 [Ulvibacter sp.]|jgi:hypothetical protein